MTGTEITTNPDNTNMTDMTESSFLPRNERRRTSWSRRISSSPRTASQSPSMASGFSTCHPLRKLLFSCERIALCEANGAKPSQRFPSLSRGCRCRPLIRHFFAPFAIFQSPVIRHTKIRRGIPTSPLFFSGATARPPSCPTGRTPQSSNHLDDMGDVRQFSVPGTAWSGIPDAPPPGPWSSAW